MGFDNVSVRLCEDELIPDSRRAGRGWQEAARFLRSCGGLNLPANLSVIKNPDRLYCELILMSSVCKSEQPLIG